MAFHDPGAVALDYFPCRYGKSKILFRGPRRRLDAPYVAVLGGSETYGKFVTAPYPALLEQGLGVTVANFGCMNAGVDLFLNDPALNDACASARVTVIQMVGAQNMSNRFYAVHPRRNDRFLRASAQMKTLFAETDFTEFHFTRHLLSHLKLRAPDRYRLVEAELKSAWVARMRHLLTRITGPSVLLWLNGGQAGAPDILGPDPLLIDADMVAAVAPLADALVRVEPGQAARAAGTRGMVFADFDEPAAVNMPGPAIHAEVAEALFPVLRARL